MPEGPSGVKAPLHGTTVAGAKDGGWRQVFKKSTMTAC
jgi:hypothetical protein